MIFRNNKQKGSKYEWKPKDGMQKKEGIATETGG
jgi:hypothetical protein